MDELVAQVNHDEPPPHSRKSSGWVEVITGSMFSGKSEELIRRLRRAQIARQKVQVFKPHVDVRSGEEHIASHSEMRLPSQGIGSASQILAAVVLVEPMPQLMAIAEYVDK